MNIEHIKAHLNKARIWPRQNGKSDQYESLQSLSILVAAVERVQAQVDKTLEILDRYNHSDDGDLPECAPEDRWRLYRDLLATLNPEALETP